MASKTKIRKEKRRGNQKTHKHCSGFHNTKHIIKTRGNNSFSRCSDLYIFFFFFFFLFFFFFWCGYKPVIPLNIKCKVAKHQLWCTKHKRSINPLNQVLKKNYTISQSYSRKQIAATKELIYWQQPTDQCQTRQLVAENLIGPQHCKTGLSSLSISPRRWHLHCEPYCFFVTRYGSPPCNFT